MTWLLGIVNLALLLLCGIANPAPREIGGPELAIGSLAALALLLLLAAVARRAVPPLAGQPSHALAALVLYGLPFLVSVAVAVLNGVGLAAALRSTLPYLVFLPVAALGLLGKGRDRMTVITGGLLIAGALHAVFLLVLYFATGQDLSDAQAVLLARTTWLDPRTTLPLVLGAAILPLGGMVGPRANSGRAARLVLAAIATLAALSTQTRSQLIALVAGFAVFLLLHAVWVARGRGAGTGLGLRRAVAAGMLTALLATAVVFTVPPVRALVDAVVQRTQQDRDTGRIDDEWAPAVNTALEQGVTGVLVGVGAGRAFVTVGGDERTYVHNLEIYALLYGGIFGLGVLLLFYLYAVASLARRGMVESDPRYFALAALVTALFVYAQFFAVHKLLSYNLMLMIGFQALLFPVAPAPRRDEA